MIFVVLKIFLRFFINNIMVYLISDFACEVCSSRQGEEDFSLTAFVPYQIEGLTDEKVLIIDADTGVPFYINLFDICKRGKKHNNVSIFEAGGDKYLLLHQKRKGRGSCVNFRYKNEDISVINGEKLMIFCSGEKIFEKSAGNIIYSHHEIFGDFCLIFFTGEKNFLAVLKGCIVVEAGAFDTWEEDNETGTRYFLARLKDALNHGRVIEVSSKEAKSYLVYLDDFDLLLNEALTAHIFLDCLVAGNFNYCNHLLAEDLRQDQPQHISEFFPVFSDYVCIRENLFLLLDEAQEQRIVGLAEFSLSDGKIDNIMIT